MCRCCESCEAVRNCNNVTVIVSLRVGITYSLMIELAAAQQRGQEAGLVKPADLPLV